MVSYCAGVHEGLRNDQQHSVHIIRRLHIKNKLRVLDDVDPEPEGKAVERTRVQQGISKGSSYSDERYLHGTASLCFALPAKPALHPMICCPALAFCSSSVGRSGSHFASSKQVSSASSRALRNTLPVCLPDMDGLRVCDPIVYGLLIQQVKEVFDCQRDRAVGTENHLEQVIHKLLQSAL